jgi:hypothetical protein
MTDRRIQVDVPDLDPQVSDAYRASATETVPLPLDKAVLADAHRIRRGAMGAIWRRSWITPMVFVATAALTLAVVLEYRQAVPLPPLTPHSDSGQPAIGTPAPDAADGLATAVQSTGRRIRDLDDAAIAIVPGNKPASTAHGTVEPTSSRANYPRDSSRYCTDESAASAEAWWSCIKGLERDGKSEAARSELERLRAAFPAFEPPD